MTLRESSTGRTIDLFPMVHVGEPSFYDLVYHEAGGADVVLVEGVKSPIVRRMTRSYRWISASKRINLVIQPPLKSSSTSAEIIRADLSEAGFEAAWRKVPIWLRALICFLAPLIGLRRRWSGSRASLAKGMSLDDALSRDEQIAWSPEGAFLEQAILHARDDELIRQIDDLLARDPSAWRTAAIVYGAHHMRRVLRELLGRRHFSLLSSNWMVVFEL